MHPATKEILNRYPSKLIKLNISYRVLNGEILDFSRFIFLEVLYCNNNYYNIKQIINLPPNLKILNCKNNKLNSLDNLPKRLEFLDCSNNNILSLDNLPSSLLKLICYSNKINCLDNLPASLKILDCLNNNLKSLDYLPSNLEELECDNNVINLSLLPNNLKINCKYYRSP